MYVYTYVYIYIYIYIYIDTHTYLAAAGGPPPRFAVSRVPRRASRLCYVRKDTTIM